MIFRYHWHLLLVFQHLSSFIAVPLNPLWHDLWKKGKCLFLAPPWEDFYTAVKISRLMSASPIQKKHREYPPGKMVKGFMIDTGNFIHFWPEMLHSPSNKAPAISVPFLVTEITTVMILVSFTYHGRTLQKLWWWKGGYFCQILNYFFCEKYFASAIATHFLQVCSFLFVTRQNRLCTSSFNVKELTAAPLNFVGQFMLDFKESWQWLDNRGTIFKWLFYILKAANVSSPAEFWVW